jgi:hypothetical protein
MDRKLIIRIIISVVGLIAAPSAALLIYDKNPNGSLINYLFISYISFAILGILLIKFLKAEREFTKPKLSREHAELQGNFNQNQNTKLSLVVVLSVVAFLLIIPVTGFPVKNFLKIISIYPFFSLSFSVSLFVFVCLANWNKSFRKITNYYLSGGEEDEKVAYARSEELLYLLNASMLLISIIIGTFSLLTLGF